MKKARNRHRKIEQGQIHLFGISFYDGGNIKGFVTDRVFNSKESLKTYKNRIESWFKSAINFDYYTRENVGAKKYMLNIDGEIVHAYVYSEQKSTVMLRYILDNKEVYVPCNKDNLVEV